MWSNPPTKKTEEIATGFPNVALDCGPTALSFWRSLMRGDWDQCVFFHDFLGCDWHHSSRLKIIFKVFLFDKWKEQQKQSTTCERNIHDARVLVLDDHKVPLPVHTTQALNPGPPTAMSQHEPAQWYLQLIQVPTGNCRASLLQMPNRRGEWRMWINNKTS